MNVKINFNNLARQLLPVHQRQSIRLAVLRAFLFPLSWLFELFDSWREEIRREINMTGQMGILQGYLRNKYNDDSIRIETFVEHGFTLGLESEGVVNAQPIGRNEADLDPSKQLPQPGVIPLQGEIRDSFGDVDFAVYVPQGIDLESVKIDINRFKLALITFKIIQS